MADKELEKKIEETEIPREKNSSGWGRKILYGIGIGLLTLPLILGTPKNSDAEKPHNQEVNNILSYDKDNKEWNSYNPDKPEFLNSLESISLDKEVYFVLKDDEIKKVYNGRSDNTTNSSAIDPIPPSEWWGTINDGDYPDSVMVRALIDKNEDGEFSDGEVFDTSYTQQGYYNIVVEAQIDSTAGGEPGDSIYVEVGGIIAEPAPAAPWISGSNDNQPITVTDVGVEEEFHLPSTTKLGNNYPNPFNPTTNIPLTLSKSANVTIDVYNIRGEKLETLINKNLEAGEHNLRWEPNTDVPTGIYFYHVKTEEFTETKKMIYEK